MNMLNDAKLAYYTRLFYRDLNDEAEAWETAEDIKSMARELLERRKAAQQLPEK